MYVHPPLHVPAHTCGLPSGCPISLFHHFVLLSVVEGAGSLLHCPDSLTISDSVTVCQWKVLPGDWKERGV